MKRKVVVISINMKIAELIMMIIIMRVLITNNHNNGFRGFKYA